MGGNGSGRHPISDARRTVEDCLVLDVNKLARNGMIGMTEWPGSLNWRDTRTGEQTASVGYACTVTGDEGTIDLGYTVRRRGGEKQAVSMRIGLQSTRLHFGGSRWWFTCPLVVDGKTCMRRVGKLYLPPGEVYFGCRHCHDLTYTSCQDSHKYDRLYASLARDVGCSAETVRTLFRNRS